MDNFGELVPEPFLSTPSARRATHNPGFMWRTADISIHALREEGDHHHQLPQNHPQISIHALREEGDESAERETVDEEISIHALREEGDISIAAARSRHCYFYPRPPRGGRLYLDVIRKSLFAISIHALREEGDTEAAETTEAKEYFYPRPPRGGRLWSCVSC